MISYPPAPIPVVTVKGEKGYAFALIDYGQEHHMIFGTVMDETGEVWWIPNPEIRVRPNFTMRANRDPRKGRIE